MKNCRITLLKFVAMSVVGLGLFGLPSPGFAEPNTIRVLAGGEDFEGPPNMVVRADSTIVGIVPIKNAVKGLGQNNMSAAEIAKTFQTYEFRVPSLDRVQTLSIEFNNDRWGGDSAIGDRNLYIGSVSAGDIQFSPEQFKLAEGKSKLAGSHVIIMSNSEISLARPASGWQAVALAPAKKVACPRKSLVLHGYTNNQKHPSAGDASQLSRWLGSVPALSGCKIRIRASTSPSGSDAANARLARARSAEIAAILLKAGMKDKQISILKPRSGERSVLIRLSP